MNSKKMHFFLFVGSLCLYSSFILGFGCKTFFNTRSQSFDAPRWLVGEQRLLHCYDCDDCYFVLAVTPEYTRTFKGDDIQKFLFGCKTLTFTGSAVQDRKSSDYLADYIGLPRDFVGSICFEPVINNFIMDFNWYAGLNALYPGLFVRIDVPIVHTKWDVNERQCIADRGELFHPAGYMSDARIERDDLAEDIKEYFTGQFTFGDMKEPLCFGKIFGRQRETRVGELRVVAGWDALCRCYSYLSFFVHVAAATGNRPNGEFLFEPIAGNGGHWEVGGGLSAYTQVYECDRSPWTLSLYFDAVVTHIIRNRQCRSFDLCNNCPGSRYMLMQDFGSPSKELFIGLDGPPAPNQYCGRLLPVINRTTLCITVSNAVQADLVVKAAVTCDEYEWDIGYNFWARSKDSLKCRSTLESGRYVLKGDTQVYGFTDDAQCDPIPLNASQHCATLHSGQFPFNPTFDNQNVDDPAGAATTGQILLNLNAQDSMDLNIAQVQVNTSNPPIFLDDCDIDVSSALLPKGFSHKIFTHFGFIFEPCGDIRPFFGIGGFVEWAALNPENNSAFSQWGLWLKGGFVY